MHPPAKLSPDATKFNRLLNRFGETTAGVQDIIAISSDGLLIAVYDAGLRAKADQLAAIVAGMTSLAGGVSSSYRLGHLNKVIVDMAEGCLLTSAIGSGSLLAVVTSREANVEQVACEMSLFVNREGAVLTPRLVHELKFHVRK